MITVNGIQNNAILKFIQRAHQVLSSNMEDFHHLKFRTRMYTTDKVEMNRKIVVKAYGVSIDGHHAEFPSNEGSFNETDLSEFIGAAVNELTDNLDTSVFVQIAPRTSLIVQENSNPFNAAVEIQFLNMNIGTLLDVIKHGEMVYLYKRYPGIEMDILVRPLEYQASPMSFKPDHSTVIPPRTAEPEPAQESKEPEVHSEALRNLQSFMNAATQAVNASAKAHENDSEEPSNPYEEVTAPMVTGGVGEDFWKILRERGAERSKFDERDNEMQKRISANKLSDDSKNVLDILDEETDEEAMVANAREADEDNLDEMFADDDEPMPEPPLNN